MRKRHDVILRSAIESHNGYVFQIIGDSVCAAFHTATDALCAAVESQRNLHAENWRNEPVKVRMGLHTGMAEIQKEGNYQGYTTLSRVERLTSAGHGGQILLSTAFVELVKEQLPHGVRLKDLGEYRLKGFLGPDHIHQLKVDGLPVDFPALRILDALPTQVDKAELFGQWLRRRRRELSLTQSELANRASCDQVTIRKLEADQLRPSKQLAEAVVAQLQVQPGKRGPLILFALGGSNPELPSSNHPKNNLPNELTSFIGRAEEMAEVKQLINEHRLVTLTGSGGTGKTRLSLQIAADLLDQFPDGVWFIELAPVTDPDLIPQIILTNSWAGRSIRTKHYAITLGFPPREKAFTDAG